MVAVLDYLAWTAWASSKIDTNGHYARLSHVRHDQEAKPHVAKLVNKPAREVTRCAIDHRGDVVHEHEGNVGKVGDV